MNEDRLRILRMIEEGKITAEEGTALIDALNTSAQPESAEDRPASTPHQWFRVRVTDTMTGKTRASVRIPIGLMDWGLKIGSQFAPEVSEVNLSELGQMLRSGVDGKIIDVVDEEDGEHVEIFVE